MVQSFLLRVLTVEAQLDRFPSREVPPALVYLVDLAQQLGDEARRAARVLVWRARDVGRITKAQAAQILE